MIRKYADLSTLELERIFLDLITYIRGNTYLINSLLVAIVAAYGFELFNFNLTIDEEIYAFYDRPVAAWIAQGRWGMYVLNKFLLPHTIIPFVPLFLALVFHSASILLMLDAWQVKSKLDRVVLAILGITFPTLAYTYTFSTFNYGIGFGLFCISLACFIYSNGNRATRYLAIIPAAFSIAIYQAFLPALISIFLVYIIYLIMRSERSMINHVFYIVLILISSTAVYYGIQKLIFFVLQSRDSGYVFQFLDWASLFGDFPSVFDRLSSTMANTYLGDKSVYAINIPMLRFLLLTVFIGIVWKVLRSDIHFVNKAVVFLLLSMLVFMPFLMGFLSRGIISMRIPIALPIVIPGLCMLGLSQNPVPFRLIIAAISGICIIQFAVSTNHLFASSQLSLEADRLLASQLIDEIQEAKETSKINNPKYLTIVGQLNRPSNELMPKIDTFGASFFEWDGGNIGRVVLFLRTIGYSDLNFLPSKRQAEFIQIAESMPKWPEKGSVQVVKDTVIVKFGDYSYAQLQGICKLQQTVKTLPQGFCP